MIWFKTRHEVKQLKKDIEFLTEMLKTHLNIKYTLEDFQKWDDLHPHTSYIPVTEGERLHFISMLLKSGEILNAKNSENIYPLFRSKTLHTDTEIFDTFMDKVEQIMLRLESSDKKEGDK